MTGKLYINSQDAFTKWGVVLTDGSYSSLLGQEQMKPYATNESRSIDGKMVNFKNPRVESRKITLTFHFVKGVFPNFDNFFNTLKSGQVNLNVPELNKTYRLLYESRTSVTYLKDLASVTVRFDEPNPTL